MTERAMKRIYHTWDEWECYPAGLYDNHPPSGITPAGAVAAYAAFLADDVRFEAALERVVSEWKNSCEHYLTNVNMNRIAWLGQASACIALGIPSAFRSGFHKLNEDQRRHANAVALKWLNVWLEREGYPRVDESGAASQLRVELY